MLPSTTKLGLIAELQFQTRCAERGIDCYSPSTGCNPSIDYVIRRDDAWHSVQVKKARITDQNGKINPRVVAQTMDARYRRTRERVPHDADFFAIVCAELNTIWMIPSHEITTVFWSKALDQVDQLSHYVF